MKDVRRILALVVALAFTCSIGRAQAPDRQRRGGRRPGFPVMQALDANGDGEISAEEMQNAQAALKKLDGNGDGKLDQTELRPQFGRMRGPQRGPGGPGAPGGDFGKPPVPKDDAEKKLLEAIRVMQQGPGFANVPESDGRLLRVLTEAVGAKCVVEIGTSTGESAVWMALALRTTGGKLFTHEIDKRRAAIARENFKKAGVDSLITVIEGDAHETVKQHKDPIDVLFIDADKEGYLDYLNKLLPLVRPGGLIVAHNMNARQADPRYVTAITTNPNLETLFLQGVGVSLKKR